MQNKTTKVLVVATSRKTRGGITSVVKAHETGEQWKKYHCQWIETHRDGNSLRKLWYLATALIEFLCSVPSYDIVHIHMSEPVSALRKLPFMFWARLWRKKTIVHFHSFSPETTIRSRYAWVYRYLFCNADAVVALSEYWKCEIGRKFDMDNKVRVRRALHSRPFPQEPRQYRRPTTPPHPCGRRERCGVGCGRNWRRGNRIPRTPQ